MTVAGVEVWNSGSAAVDTYKTKTGATHSLLLNGYLPMRNGYDAGKNEYFIIDQNGIVRFHDTLPGLVYTWMVDTLVNRMTATIDMLLASFSVSRPPVPAMDGFRWYFPGGSDIVIHLQKPEFFSVGLFDVSGQCLGRGPAQPWSAGRHRVRISGFAARMQLMVLKGTSFQQILRVPVSR